MKHYLHQQSPLKRSFSILHSFFSAVFITFMLDFSTVGSYVHHKTIHPFASGFIFLLAWIIQIYVYSGLYGIFVELMSNEYMIFKKRNFKKNVKSFWKFYLFICLIPFGLHLLCFIVFPEREVPFNQILAFVIIPLLYMMANKIVKEKYVRPDNLTIQKKPLGYKILITIFVLYALHIFLYYFSKMQILPYINIPRFVTLISKYVQLFSFIYFSHILIAQYPDIEKKFTHKKELFLINPLGGGVFFGVAFSLGFSSPPIFVVLKALTPSSYHIRSFNRLFWQKEYFRSNVLVAISCYSTNSYEAYHIAKEFKRRGSTVIMGGPHVTFLPDEALAYCDSVVIGEAEAVWKQIIHDYENNCLQRKYIGKPLEDYYKEVHQELLNSPVEVVSEFLETTRGCKFHCDFCTIYPLNRGRVRKKPVEEVVALVKKLRGRHRHFHFIDNNIYSDPTYAKALFKALKPYKIKWQTAATLDMGKNDEVLQLAKDCGCEGFLIGYEIFGDSFEQRQGGKFAMAKQYKMLTKKIKDKGFKIKASFIFGFESDGYKSIFKLWKFCFSLMPYSSSLSILTPLPGTKFYYDMLQENRIINLNWRSYSMLNLVYAHKRMNHFFLSHFFPVISFLFAMSTSRVGVSIAILFSTIIFYSFILNL